ncbi:MAG: AAA family ATPase [Desulfobacteraceae bacterium]|nr:AAA family ATPase [Desulfobacteraceae bacterium]
MIISRLKLQNWKNFQNVEIELGSRVFVVGPNASGKSNFLDVIRFLRDIVKQGGGFQYAVAERDGVSKIRCLSARNKTDVSIEVYLSEKAETEPDWIYKLSFKHFGGGIFKNQAAISEEKVWSKKEDKWILSRTSKSGKEDDETKKYTYLEHPTSNAKFREIYHFFRDIQYLHVVPQLVRDADSYFLSAGKEDYYGRNLLERMAATAMNTRNAFLNKINKVLSFAVPQFDKLDFVPGKDDKKGVPHLQLFHKNWRARGVRQYESQLSDGTLRLIGFMWALLDGKETILLEEPELHLHTEIVKHLPEFISNIQRRKSGIRQVILTTHSFDLLSSEGIGADEVILLDSTLEGTKIIRTNQLDDIKKYLKAGFSMAEAVIPRTKPKEIEKITQLELV